MTKLLSTHRLLIRTWQPCDRVALQQMTGDAQMMHYLSDGRAWRDDEIDEFLARQQAHQARHNICMGVLATHAAAAVVGVAGLQPLDDGTFELGWWVWKDHWGLGYASEAGRALIQHAREAMQLPQVLAVIDPGNQASIRVAESIGMRYLCQKPACKTVARRGERIVSIYQLTL